MSEPTGAPDWRARAEAAEARVLHLAEALHYAEADQRTHHDHCPRMDRDLHTTWRALRTTSAELDRLRAGIEALGQDTALYADLEAACEAERNPSTLADRVQDVMAARLRALLAGSGEQPGDETGARCCTAPDCCGPGSWCCTRAGAHTHDGEPAGSGEQPGLCGHDFNALVDVDEEGHAVCSECEPSLSDRPAHLAPDSARRWTPEEADRVARSLMSPPDGWFVFGHHAHPTRRRPDALEFWGDDGTGDPIWERPVSGPDSTDVRGKVLHVLASHGIEEDIFEGEGSTVGLANLVTDLLAVVGQGVTAEQVETIDTADDLATVLATSGLEAEPVVVREGFRIWTLTEDEDGEWWAWSWREEGEDGKPVHASHLRLPLTVLHRAVARSGEQGGA